MTHLPTGTTWFLCFWGEVQLTISPSGPSTGTRGQGNGKRISPQAKARKQFCFLKPFTWLANECDIRCYFLVTTTIITT